MMNFPIGSLKKKADGTMRLRSDDILKVMYCVMQHLI